MLSASLPWCGWKCTGDIYISLTRSKHSLVDASKTWQETSRLQQFRWEFGCIITSQQYENRCFGLVLFRYLCWLWWVSLVELFTCSWTTMKWLQFRTGEIKMEAKVRWRYASLLIVSLFLLCRIGALFFVTMNMTFSNNVAVAAFINERAIFVWANISLV